jgi:uncharacterized protein
MPKSFRDPIHGFITLSDAECELLDTAPIRRLRNIRQLALTNLVYHGAEHTRFGHTLGVMHQATAFFDTVVAKRGLPWTPEDKARRRQLLRLAALCHDVGHSPFSHAGEEGNLLKRKHEQYSAAIVTATSGSAGEIRQVLEARRDDFFGVRPEEIADVILGQAVGLDSFLFSMLSGDLDCDRTDYLQRDSLYCGVNYGRFDSDRLVSTLTWIEDPLGGNPVLAIEEDGIHAAEGLILSRYFMFTQVYFHRVRRAYDFHLGAALRSEIGTYPDIDELEEYLGWDDIRVYQLLRDRAGEASEGAKHANRILKRDHYRVAFQTVEHPRTAEVRRWKTQLVPQVEARFGNQIAFDYAEKAPHSFDRNIRDFPVVKHASAQPSSIEEESALLDKLEEIQLCRILAPRELRDEVGEYCDSLRLAGRRPAE